MKPGRTVPLIKNIYNTNVNKIKPLRVVDNKREIIIMKFSSDEQFLLVSDKEKTTLYNLTDRTAPRVRCSIFHDGDPFDAYFMDDNHSFAIIFKGYTIRRYTHEGILIGTSNIGIRDYILPFKVNEPVFIKRFMVWLRKVEDRESWLLNVFDFCSDRYKIQGMDIEEAVTGCTLEALYMNSGNNRVIVVLEHVETRKIKVITIDVELRRIIGELQVEDVVESYSVSKCGSYLGIYTESSEFWVYKLFDGDRSFIHTYECRGAQRLSPFGHSSFACKSPPTSNLYGFDLIVYDPEFKSKTKHFKGLADLSVSSRLGRRPFSFFQVTDDLKYFMGATPYEKFLVIYDVEQVKVVGKLEKIPNIDFTTALLSPRGTYAAVICNKDRVYIFERERLPCTTKYDLPNVDLVGYPSVKDDRYLMYECHEQDKELSWKSHYYYRFLEYSRTNREIIQKGDTPSIYRYKRYLGNTGYYIYSDLNHHVGFFSIESGTEILNLRIFKIVGIHRVACSPSGKRVAVTSLPGKMLIYDTGYLNALHPPSIIPTPRCINKTRISHLFNENNFVVKFISDHLIFIGDEERNIKILNIETSSTEHQNQIDAEPSSAVVVNEDLLLVVCRKNDIGPIRLYLWNLIHNNVSPVILDIAGSDIYEFDAYRLSVEIGIIAIAINDKGLYTIEIQNSGKTKYYGDLGRIFFSARQNLYGLFDILPKGKKLIIMDAPRYAAADDYSYEHYNNKIRIRIWDLETGRPQFEKDRFLEEYKDIDILMEKYIVLWTQKDGHLKIYDLNLDCLNMEALMDCGKYQTATGKIKIWEPDKVVTIGRDLNIFQIIEP